MISKKLKLSKKAQVTVEAALISGLVAIAVVNVAQFAKGTFFGRVKAYEDEFSISEGDPLRQAPTNNYRIPDCNCGAWQNDRCGGPHPHQTPLCPFGYMRVTRTCTGGACAYMRPPPVTWQCVVDPSCCDDWAFTCDPSSGDYSCCGANSRVFSSVAAGVDPRDMKCLDGYGAQTRTCGTTIVEHQCARYAGRPNGCDFLCVGPVDPNSHQCDLPPTTLERERLLGDTNYDLVPPGGCSTPAGSYPKCEQLCNNGYIYKTGPERCETCPRAKVTSMGHCRCTGGGGGNAPEKVCDEGPYTDPTCTNGARRDCRNLQPVIANCPTGTFAESGFCGAVATHSFCGWRNPQVPGQPTSAKNAWRCPGLAPSCYNGGSTCHISEHESIAFCVPPVGSGCGRPVLEDIVIVTRPTTCPAGYRYLVFWWGDFYRACTKIIDVIPSDTCPGGAYRAMTADVILLGSDKGLNRFQWGWRAINRANTCPVGDAGTPSQWYAWGWDGWARIRHCAMRTENQCTVTGSCPLGSTRKSVVRDLSMFWEPNPVLFQSARCETQLGAAWTTFFKDNNSRIVYCKRTAFICAKN